MPMGLLLAWLVCLVLAAPPCPDISKGVDKLFAAERFLPFWQDNSPPNMTIMHDSYKINALYFLKPKPDTFLLMEAHPPPPPSWCQSGC